jgi:hypothetical protein
VNFTLPHALASYLTNKEEKEEGRLHSPLELEAAEAAEAAANANYHSKQAGAAQNFLDKNIIFRVEFYCTFKGYFFHNA